jgi:hypothetical protein
MLKARITKEEWEGLPDEVKTHYAEAEDGTYGLGVTPVDGLELMNPANLKKALSSERSKASEAEKARKAVEAKWGDLEPDAARDALAKLEEMAGMDPEGKAKAEREAFEKNLSDKFEADRKKFLDKHTAEREADAKERTVLEAQLENQLIAAAASKAIADAGGSVELLLPIVRQSTRMKKNDDGTFSVVVLDAEGTERLSPVAGSTTPMSISELVEEKKGDKKYARAYDGSGASGSGAGRSGAQGSGASAYKLSGADAKNPAKYRAAKEAADKAGRDLVIGE